MSGPVQRFIDALRANGTEPKQSANGWTCRCPAHDDRNPSLSIGTGDKGDAVVKCFTGCPIDSICAAIGLHPRDLFTDSPRRGSNNFRRPAPKDNRKPLGKRSGNEQTFPTAEAAIAQYERQHGSLKWKPWAYDNTNGEPIGYILRWDTPTGKEIRPVSRTSTGWVLLGFPAPRPPYRLLDLLNSDPADRIHIVEGERCADAAHQLGYLATTSAHGADGAEGTDWTSLAGHDVVIFPDNDEAGERYADKIMSLVTAAGVVSVRVVRLKDIWPEIPDDGDIADMVANAGGDPHALKTLRQNLDALIESTSIESPASEPESEFTPITAYDLIRGYPKLRPVVIDGLARQGETLNVVAPPKVGKTWLIHAVAMACISGGEWMGKAVTRGRVLLIDGELHRETLAKRLRTVQQSLAIENEYLSQLDVWAVRGRKLTVDEIAERLKATSKATYTLIILDALYRFLPENAEENANEAMTRVYNTLDAIADQADATIVVVHHSSKGDQSSKAVTDVGAGAGAQSRAADSHMILRQHEVDDAVVVDAVVRSFPPMPSFVIRNRKPGWELAPDLDPTQLRQSTRRKSRPAVKEKTEPAPVKLWTPETFAEEVVGGEKSIKDDVIARAQAKGMSKTQAEGLLARGLESGAVHRHRTGPSDPHRFSTCKPNPMPTLTLTGGEGDSPSNPPPPGAIAHGGYGGTRATPLPPTDPQSSKESNWVGVT